MQGTMTTTEYLTHVVKTSHTNPYVKKSAKTFHGVFLEAAKLELRRRGAETEGFDYSQLKPVLDRIRNLEDCAEFGIPALIRMLKEYRDMLDPEVVREIEETLVGFRYWLDEPGEINACYFSENHQVLYHSAEILVGNMFPNAVFPSNGKSGAWHAQHGKTFLNRWIDWRTRLGFSEWTCNYYAEDIIAMLGLAFYADDEELKRRMTLLINTMMFDIAINSFKGHWIGTHGRTYARFLVNPQMDSISPICRMYFGDGDIDGDIADCAIMMAIYDYKVPEAIVKAAQDPSPVMISKERMSIDTKDAKYYGIDPADFDNIMFFWGMQVYDAKDCIANSAKVMTPSNWMNERINAYLDKYRLCDLAGIPCDEDPDFTAMTQADLYTYKTPDYAVSCAQDFRKGKLGYQQHPWGATLGGRAVVFTNHPGSMEYNDRPNLITGNWHLPRAVQHENVVLCIYRCPADCIRMLETHAYFPQAEFDEVVEKGGWVFGRKGDGYVALKSLLPAEWKQPDPEMFRTIYAEELWEEEYRRAKPYLYHANGHANVWVTELGSKAQNGSFEAFMARFDGVEIVGDSFDFTYQSPSQGCMRFGWGIPFTIDRKEVVIRDYPRYDNPFCKAEFGGKKMEISCGGESYLIDHEK